MKLTPVSCMYCGELVIARQITASIVVLPVHPDRVTPTVECSKSNDREKLRTHRR